MPAKTIAPPTSHLAAAEIDNLRASIAAALEVAAHEVAIEGYRTRYMSLFVQCWGTAKELRFFAKIFLVDDYPIPPRFATPSEELHSDETHSRPVEEQIRVEAEKFRYMRRVMGDNQIPALLGCSAGHRTLVYEQVNGTRLDSLIRNRIDELLSPTRRKIYRTDEAFFRAGAWLRRLHRSTENRTELIDYGLMVRDLRGLLQKKHLEKSSYGVRALQALEIAQAGGEFDCPLEVPVALNHGDFTAPNLLWEADSDRLWVIDFELSSQRPILHDLCTMVFDLRRHLLHPLGSPKIITRSESSFWAGYGPPAPELMKLVNALANARLYYDTLPKVKDWRRQKGLWPGAKSFLYRWLFEPVLTRHLG